MPHFRPFSSQAVEANGTLYISGQLGMDPATGALQPDVERQADWALKNMGEILKEAGMSMSNVVKTTVLLDDMNDFHRVNEVYAKHFTEVGVVVDGEDGITCLLQNYPARAAYEVAKLPKNALVEIEAVAVRE